jgi:hypothetical protein
MREWLTSADLPVQTSGEWQGLLVRNRDRLGEVDRGSDDLNVIRLPIQDQAPING